MVVVVHAFSTQRQRQVNLKEFKASLVCRESCRAASAWIHLDSQTVCSQIAQSCPGTAIARSVITVLPHTATNSTVQQELSVSSQRH